MKDTIRLTFIDQMTNENLDELWQNSFSTVADLNHINAHTPFPVRYKGQLDKFLINRNNYQAWLIKRISEKDIIGFLIHGDFFPGRPNNIGFNIGRKYVRQGYATESLKALIKHLRVSGHQETFGHCFESNVASIKTMENCGFVNLGRTGKHYGNNSELKFRIEL